MYLIIIPSAEGNVSCNFHYVKTKRGLKKLLVDKSINEEDIFKEIPKNKAIDSWGQNILILQYSKIVTPTAETIVQHYWTV
jgi:hypothetical protein